MCLTINKKATAALLAEDWTELEVWKRLRLWQDGDLRSPAYEMKWEPGLNKDSGNGPGLHVYLTRDDGLVSWIYGNETCQWIRCYGRREDFLGCDAKGEAAFRALWLDPDDYAAAIREPT